MIYTVTLNPATDIHYRVPGFAVGRESYADSVLTSCGGKGINVSRALTALGTENEALFLGDADGAFLSRIRAEGIRAFAVPTGGHIRENVTIHDPVSGETRISLDTFSVTETEFAAISEALFSRLSAGDTVAFCGRNPKGVEKSAVMDLLKAIKAHGAALVLDSNSFTPEDILDVLPDLIKPNEQELAAFGDFSDVTSTAERLHEAGIRHVMISLGGDGIVYAGDTGVFRVSAPKITVRSTIGAGDSAIAGFIAAATAGKSARDCVRMAVAAGSAACLTEGTAPPAAETVCEFLKSIR